MLCAPTLLLCTTAGLALAQVPDTVAVPAAPIVDTVAPPRADTLPSPVIVLPGTRPISPRAAFLRSLVVPGSGQISMNRSISAGVFAFTEIVAVGMARKSALDLREARRAPVDSTPVGYQRDPATGHLILDAETGQPIPTSFVIDDLGGRVRARKTHLEDWIAVLIFNHLFAAADAYVAAHLWDFPARVGATVTPEREARVSASIAW